MLEFEIQSFTEYVHNNITPMQCQGINAGALVIGFTAYFIWQIHFALVAFFGVFEA